jgi:8-oxo-dGTP pyrophosphatase MutT (NUDIX family)
MAVEPKNFFIGVVDFFSVLLPGALLTWIIQEPQKEFFDRFYSGLSGIPKWVAFLFIAYVLGHLIFVIGALLDDFIYEPIRNSTPEREIDRLADSVGPPSALDRFLAPVRRYLAPVRRYLAPARRILAALLVKKDSDNALDQAIVIKEYYVNKLGLHPGINAFQWCKARLALEKQSEALATVLRFEADSKFFRSFAIVIFVFFIWKLSSREIALAIGSLLFLLLALWRYFEQRLKATNQSYWYVITMEAASPTGYRRTHPSRAGGVVYRRGEHAEIEYLIIQAKDNADWVLPKGHIEPNESQRTTAVREVCEETGICARIESESELGTASFELGNEHVEVVFYLMEASGSCEPQEKRPMQWLPIDKAVESITHKESKKMLLRARLRLNPERKNRS